MSYRILDARLEEFVSLSVGTAIVGWAKDEETDFFSLGETLASAALFLEEVFAVVFAANLL